MTDIIAVLPARFSFFEKKQLRHSETMFSVILLLFHRTFELGSVQDRPTQPLGIIKPCMLCSLTFNLISLPNLHPLWPDHTSVNVDSSAGSLTFSLTLNHSVMTSDRDHIQPRLAANCPQLHLGFTTKLSLRHHSAFISGYDCICSRRRFDIRIFQDSPHK